MTSCLEILKSEFDLSFQQDDAPDMGWMLDSNHEKSAANEGGDKTARKATQMSRAEKLILSRLSKGKISEKSLLEEEVRILKEEHSKAMIAQTNKLALVVREKETLESELRSIQSSSQMQIEEFNHKISEQ